jgi:sulfoquinovose isomerase
MPSPWSDSEIRAEYDADFRAIVDFARGSRVDTGFGYMGPDGRVDTSRPVELWITCRMTHVFCLAALQGVEGAAELADHGLAALRGPLRDPVHGGWYSQIGHAVDGTGAGVPVPGSRKEAYAHAFVVLAATSAVAAGRAGAGDLLSEALEAEERWWWEPEYGRVRESWDLAFTQSEDYRGVNANMHTTECFLSAFDVTGDRTWLDRACGILRFVHDQAGRHDWRIPEHFSATWEALPDYNRDQPAHPFRPFGVTPGHGLEWSRLMLQARAALVARGETPGEWMLEGARHLFRRAVEDGWAVDGAPGFVYTTDFEGRPVVRERMHWVLCEAIGAAVVQGKVLAAEDEARGTSAYREDIEGLGRDFATWDGYARQYLREAPGRWFHELTPRNTPGTRTWPGKPDAYHVAQMLLLPRLPATPTFATALRDGLLEPLGRD